MEGESPLLKDGALSLQTSLTHRELPPYPRPLRSDHLFRFLSVAGIWGKFLGLDGRCFFQSAAIAPDWRGARNDMRGIALKCGVVGNAPCVVPIREMLPANLFPCDFYVSGDSSPLISRLRRQLPPKGKPFCKSLFVLHDKAVSKSIYTPLIPLLQRQTACSLLPLRGNLFARVFSATRQGDKRKHLHTPSSSPAATNRLQSSHPQGEAFLTLCNHSKQEFEKSVELHCHGKRKAFRKRLPLGGKLAP